MDIAILGSVIIGGLAFFGVVIGKRLEIENHRKETLNEKQRKVFDDVIAVFNLILNNVPTEEEKKILKLKEEITSSKQNELILKTEKKIKERTEKKGKEFISKIRDVKFEMLKYSSSKIILFWKDFEKKSNLGDMEKLYKSYDKLLVAFREEIGLVNNTNIFFKFWNWLDKIVWNTGLKEYDAVLSFLTENRKELKQFIKKKK